MWATVRTRSSGTRRGERIGVPARGISPFTSELASETADGIRSRPNEATAISPKSDGASQRRIWWRVRRSAARLVARGQQIGRTRLRDHPALVVDDFCLD